MNRSECLLGKLHSFLVNYCIGCCKLRKLPHVNQSYLYSRHMTLHFLVDSCLEQMTYTSLFTFFTPHPFLFDRALRHHLNCVLGFWWSLRIRNYMLYPLNNGCIVVCALKNGCIVVCANGKFREKYICFLFRRSAQIRAGLQLHTFYINFLSSKSLNFKSSCKARAS